MLALGLFSLNAVHASAVQAQTRMGTAPAIDGRLDEPFWQDGATLYLALRAHEPNVKALVARALRRDAEAIDSDDHIAIVLDPQGTGRNGFVFRVNALGAQRDGLIADGSVARADWDTLWDAAAQIDS